MYDSDLHNRTSGRISPDIAPAAIRAGSDGPRVAILMGTRNGQLFLEEQLSSIAAQEHGRWQVWASDDGSTDGTRELLTRYQAAWGDDRLAVRSGPQRGFAPNFMSLVCNPEIAADCYAYCDQDDVWEQDKLSRALAWLATVPRDVPALYCGRTRLIDDAGAEIGFSPLFTHPPHFANALVQNLGGGNTQVFNDAARRLVQSFGADLDLVSHDWWTYLVVLGCGGRVFYDPVPGVRYRQHASNAIGSNTQISARLRRVLGVLYEGRFKRWNDLNVAAVRRIEGQLTPEHRRIYQNFVAARSGRLWKRASAMRRSGIFRQSALDNLGLVVALLTNRL